MLFARVALSREGQRAAQRPLHGFRIGRWHRRILHFRLSDVAGTAEFFISS
jgi:hypothetical protein